MRWWIVCGVIVLVACGGRVSGEGDGGAGPAGSASSDAGGGGSGSGGGASSGDAAFHVCPPDPPRIGTTCTIDPGQGCAYVEGASCTSFVCDANGNWQSTTEGC